jgi:hypothetical protein
VDFDTTGWILISIGAAVVVLLLVGLVVALRERAKHQRRTTALRRRFGDEYGATVERLGRRRGESELEDRVRRFGDLELARVDPDMRDDFTERWKQVQYHFIDDPAYSVREAEHLLEVVMRERGVPGGDFETRLGGLSVAEPQLASRYRDAYSTFRSAEDGESSLASMFGAMRTYRDLFEAVIGRPKREAPVHEADPPDEVRPLAGARAQPDHESS